MTQCQQRRFVRPILPDGSIDRVSRVPWIPIHVPWVLMTLLMWISSGCDRGPHVVPVRGTVTYLGTPLAVGGITFEPEIGRSAFGRIENGKILDVTTFEPGDGVIVGRARVGIQSTTNLGLVIEPHDPLIPPRYFDPTTSGLTVEITANGDNEFTIPLEGKISGADSVP
jgi:hypothetical protein